MFATTCTRPGVSYSLSMVSRYQENPGLIYWTVVQNIVKYFRNAKDMFLVYGDEPDLVVNGYSDASFQTYMDDSKSQYGWVFVLNSGAMTWKSSKQHTMVDSSCEQEYIVACEASKEATQIRNFISDLGVVPSNKYLLEIFYDKKGTIAMIT